jgi:hypothetical protein
MPGTRCVPGKAAYARPGLSANSAVLAGDWPLPGIREANTVSRPFGCSWFTAGERASVLADAPGAAYTVSRPKGCAASAPAAGTARVMARMALVRVRVVMVDSFMLAKVSCIGLLAPSGALSGNPETFSGRFEHVVKICSFALHQKSDRQHKFNSYVE